ncbi:MAG TPA: hypothetical protein VF600_07080 [Abditibacteriaceae bacterium]|jgi:hypothetical protein
MRVLVGGTTLELVQHDITQQEIAAIETYGTILSGTESSEAGG